MANIFIYSNIKQIVLRASPLILLFILFLLFIHFDLYQYLSFDALKIHQIMLKEWTHNHYLLMCSSFMGIYILATAMSIPGAIFLTLAGGFLFGLLWGTIFVVFSATVGAVLLYLAVRFSFTSWIHHKISGRWAEMREGFQRNAFNYLLVLRLIPAFPFWLVNIVPALLNIPLRTYITATALGIVPASFIYVALGNSLNQLFLSDKTPNLAIIFTPQIILPLMGLAALSLLPVLYKQFRKKEQIHLQEAANQELFDEGQEKHDP